MQEAAALVMCLALHLQRTMNMMCNTTMQAFWDAQSYRHFAALSYCRNQHAGATNSVKTGLGIILFADVMYSAGCLGSVVV